MIKAAGILFQTKDNMVLFLKRAPEGDHAGEWCFPGGKIEEGETAEQAARREALEEVGPHPRGPLLLHARRISNPEVAAPSATPGVGVAAPPLTAPAPGAAVDFTTYLQKLDAPFEPVIDGEHVGYAWAPADAPPQPLHPGCAVALSKLTMDETAVARAMAAGELTSPQWFHNMALYAMRITGTGIAFRKGINEYVYRRPSDYLTEEFLARCNGLTVIFEHPPKAVMDSNEFNKRVVGSMLVSYIQGDEVWGIARIYDDAAITLMETLPLSTSPTVVFRDPKKNSKIVLEDGSSLLIEGKPDLLDHLAICEKGVWDKGGEPRGITSETRGDNDMTDEELKAKAKADAEATEKEAKEKADAEEKAKADAAEAGQKLDKILSCVDSVVKRMDSFEAKEKERADAEEKAKADAEEEARKKGDPEQIAADKKKADAEEEAKAKEKADAEAKEKEEAKADSEATKKRLEELTALVTPRSDEDRAAFADAQARADDAYRPFNKRAPQSLPGETLLDYRRRLAKGVQEHSAFKDADLVKIADDSAFTLIESSIYADAVKVANSPASVPAGELREMVSHDTTGRRISTFAGTPGAWMGTFGANRRRLSGIRNV